MFQARAAHQQPQNAAQSFGQLVAVNDHIDHAMLQQILGALETFRQFFLDCILNDTRARKTDKRAGLGDLNIAQHP